MYVKVFWYLNSTEGIFVTCFFLVYIEGSFLDTQTSTWLPRDFLVFF